MFYDDFTPDQICGLFSVQHITVMIALFIVIAGAVWLSAVKMSKRGVWITLLVIAILSTVLEIVKIAIRLYKGEGFNSWVPLYFCSLFIYALWLAICKTPVLRNTGCAFLLFGGVFAGISFLIMPSTSLAFLPLWHPSSLHSLLYHSLMIYSGFIVLCKGFYVPRAKHFLNYLVFVTFFFVLAYVVNHYNGSNLMFVTDPVDIAPLKWIYEKSHIAYTIVVYLGHTAVLFWLIYSLYKLGYFVFRRRKK